MGRGEYLSIREFFVNLCHFLVIARLGGWQPPMRSMVHVFLFVKSGWAWRFTAEGAEIAEWDIGFPLSRE